MGIIKETKNNDNWIAIIPVSGIRLTKSVNSTFSICRVQLYSREKLLSSKLSNNVPSSVLKSKNFNTFPVKGFLEGHKTFAIIKLKGYSKNNTDQLQEIIREELNILSCSQLGWSTRKNKRNIKISISGEGSSTAILAINRETLSFSLSHNVVENPIPLNLSENWKTVQKGLFFYKLLRIINGKVSINEKWRNTLKRAAIMIGQSQNSLDISFTFLWNMIVIEMLLTRQNDKYSNVLPERIESFLGWTGYWEEENFSDRIGEIYKKRCQFVHDGNKSKITIQDVEFSDHLLVNLLTNIVQHIKIFDSKEAILKYSEKFKAEKILGIKSKVQPKTLKIVNVGVAKKQDLI